MRRENDSTKEQKKCKSRKSWEGPASNRRRRCSGGNLWDAREVPTEPAQKKYLSLSTVAILKGVVPCVECAEVRGAGSRNEDCRQQPPPTDYVYSLQLTKEKLQQKMANPHILCVLRPPSNPHLVYFSCQLRLYVYFFHMLPFLSCVAKTSSFGLFLTRGPILYTW